MPYKLDPNTGKWSYTSDSSNSDKTKVLQGDPAATEDEIKGTTDNLTEENANDVFGRGKAKGNHRIRKYGKVHMVGIGKSFEGTYFFSEVTHTISSNGYEVDFSIKTKQENIGKSESTEDVTKSPSESAGRQPDSPSSSSSGGYKLDPVTGTWSKV